MINAIALAFCGVSGAGGESGSIFSGVSSAIGGFGLGGNAGDGAPAAYVNYILFDKAYKVLDMGWTRVPATSFSKQNIDIDQVTIKEAGFIFVYLSYEDESNNFVQFDDFTVTHTPSKLIQASEYYPFGMQTANSWTREETTGNNFLGNGGAEFNSTSSNYDLMYRNYDPALGRMNQVDPLAVLYDRHSPYNFALNNPAILNDPMGDRVISDLPEYYYGDGGGYSRPNLWAETMADAYKVMSGQMFESDYISKYEETGWSAEQAVMRAFGVTGNNGYWREKTYRRGHEDSRRVTITTKEWIKSKINLRLTNAGDAMISALRDAIQAIKEKKADVYFDDLIDLNTRFNGKVLEYIFGGAGVTTGFRRVRGRNLQITVPLPEELDGVHTPIMNRITSLTQTFSKNLTRPLIDGLNNGDRYEVILRIDGVEGDVLFKIFGTYNKGMESIYNEDVKFMKNLWSEINGLPSKK